MQQLSTPPSPAAMHADPAPSAFRHRLLPLLILLAVSTGLMLPVWLVGLPFSAHDAPTHLRWQIEFAQQLWDGDLYPRWLSGLNEGFGSPAFFIYPPLPHFAAALLAPLSDGNAWAQQRLGIASFLAFFLSGIGAYLWLRALTRERISALCGALMFLLAPYHLFLDTFYRAAYAELWALACAPFALWGIHLFAGKPVRGILVYTGATAGLFFSHAPSCLVLPPVYLVYAALLSYSGKRKDIVAWTCAGSLAASLIAGAYLATALTHQENINFAALYTDFFRFDRWFLLSHYWPGGTLSKVSFISVSFVQMGLLCAMGAMMLRSAGLEAKQRMLLNWSLAGSLLIMVLMTSPSAPLWKLIPLAQKIQFPWRLLTAQTVLLALVAALYVLWTQRTTRRLPRLLRRWSMPALLAALVVLNIGLSFYTGTDFDRDPHPGNNDVAEYQLAPLAAAADLFTGDGLIQLIDGRGTVKYVPVSPRHVRVEIDAQTPVRFIVRQFYYPGWECAGAATACSTSRFSDKLPVLAVQAEAGRGQLDLTLARAASEKNGYLISLAGIVLLAGLCVAGYLRKPAPVERS